MTHSVTKVLHPEGGKVRELGVRSLEAVRHPPSDVEQGFAMQS